MSLNITTSVLTRLVDFAQQAGLYSYITLSASMFIEGSSLPFPGTFILILSGFLIRQFRLSPGLMVIIGAASYTTASLIPYFVGKQVNQMARKRFEKFMKKNQAHIETGEKLFKKYGEIAVCLSRPTFLGNYFSYVAGMNNMNLLRFILYTFSGIAPWIMLMNYVGYTLGDNIDDVQRIMDRTGPLIYVIILVPFIVFFGVKFGLKRLNK